MRALVLGALLLLPAGAARAQEVGVFASLATSENDQLRRPTGFGAFVSTSPVPFVVLRATYQEQRHIGDHATTVCNTYWPDFESCTQEQVEQGARLTTWSAAALLRIPVSPGVHLEVGGGPSRSRVHAIERTESGRPLGNVYPDGNQDGFVLIAGTVIDRPFGMPVSANIEGTRSRVDFEGCFIDVGSPFCGKEHLTELRVGLRYRFR